MEGITNAKILKEYQYNNLIEKQKEGELNEKNTYILDKYFLSKKFIIDIEKIDGDFVEEHFRKKYVIDNYNKFSGDEEMKREAGGQGEISVGRIFGAATPPGALVHVI